MDRTNAVARGWLGVGAAAVAAVTASGALGGSSSEALVASRTAAVRPTLAVVVVGGGRVTSAPAGISCPGKCAAAFAAGSRVLLTQTPKRGSRFLRWGGSCRGARACRVRVSALSAVAAQFVGQKTQPQAPVQSAVEPGTYSGRDPRGFFLTFSVPAGAGSVLAFTSTVNVACAGGGGAQTALMILKATIKPDRSFTATTSQNAVVNGANAKLTSFLTGRFQGPDKNGATTAAGIYREDIVFTDTPNKKCTSNDRSWVAARTLGPPGKSVEPGTYSGRDPLGFFLTFSVPAGAGSVLGFTSTVNVACAGGGGAQTALMILKATIKPDRSFTATTSQNAVVNGANAKLTSSVTGYFLGPDKNGAATAAGIYREDIVFTDTPSKRCTSNERSWTAARSG